MNCEEIQVLLEGGTSPAEEAVVAEHLGQCAACAQYAARLEEENRVLRKALALPPGAERWQRVKARAAAGADLETFSRTRRRRAYWAVAGVAAAVAFSVTIIIVRRDTGVQTPESLAAHVATLQEEVRSSQVLDELDQLQIVFRETGDADGRSVAEDAELYVERLLALDAQRVDQAREVLAGIKAAGIHKRLLRVRDSISEDAPTPLRASLDLAASTLGKAAYLADSKGRHHGR
jgi:hypothetical protein